MSSFLSIALDMSSSPVEWEHFIDLIIFSVSLMDISFRLNKLCSDLLGTILVNKYKGSWSNFKLVWMVCILFKQAQLS